MKTKELMQTASLAFNRIGFKLQKKSPEILVAVGVCGVVVSTVMACKATTKAGAIAKSTADAIEDIHDAAKEGVTKAGESYSNDDMKKDLAITYAHAGMMYAKLYMPAAMMGASSIACIVMSHRILKKRNIALAAAYTTLDKSFKEYRGRVVERFGEQVEKELRYNIKAKEVETTVVDEKGKEKKVKETKNVATNGWDPSQYSPYARFFDENNRAWMKDPEQSRFYLKAIQAQANDRLRARGHLFLNEVYEMLRFPLTDYGQNVGWIYDLKNPKGDNFVDFGIIEVRCEADSEFGGDYVEGFILDFNTVGDVTGELADHQYL